MQGGQRPGGDLPRLRGRQAEHAQQAGGQLVGDVVDVQVGGGPPVRTSNVAPVCDTIPVPVVPKVRYG